jgi:HD-GYP domain-containing protein (c-di-GMP phosphodiesterase class II)
MAAMQNPGTVVQINAAQEERLLAIAHIVPNTDWVLLRVHPAHFILQAAQSQAQLLFWGLAAGFGLLFSLGFLVHQRRLAARQVRLADEEARARRFLSLIADQQPTAIAVLEANGNARFVNATLKHWSNADIGSNLAVLFGLAATQLQEMVDHARKGHEAHAIINDGTRRLSVRVSNFTATHMPPNPERSTSQPPQPPSGDVMIVAEDVTELLSARERREAELTALVRALTGLIDARDPGSAHHSARVARVAAAIAKVQNMGSLAEETVYTAGQLMNLGKILIPRSLLTKEGPLSPEERERVQAALARSADVLKNIPFSGPVGDTIANINNPEASHNPLVQIVRLANAYVGMVSPRAHRAPLTPEAALAELRRDPVLSPPVSALAHWLDNLGGRRALEAEQVDS